MAIVPPKSFFKPEDVTIGLVAEIREISDYLFSREGFQEVYATRKGFNRMLLTATIKTLSKPEELILGAPAVENITFVKREGDFPGTLILYKDRLIFHTTSSYRLSGVTSVEKERELKSKTAELQGKTTSKNLFFEGTLEKFSLTRLAGVSKLEVISFMQDVKSALFGMSLKAF